MTPSARREPGLSALSRARFAKRDRRVLAALRAGTVGIAGAGGLGSTVAVSLARAGVGRLIIADFDRIEASNLDRQQYFLDQIGRRKVDALRENLARIDPSTECIGHAVRVTRANAGRLFDEVDILVEAFDNAATKRMLIEVWLARHPDRPLVAASGLAGYGKTRALHTRRMGNLYLCGDEAGAPPKGISPMAPRVGIVANMQANLVVELLVARMGEGPRAPSANPRAAVRRR